MVEPTFSVFTATATCGNEQENHNEKVDEIPQKIEFSKNFKAKITLLTFKVQAKVKRIEESACQT